MLSNTRRTFLSSVAGGVAGMLVKSTSSNYPTPIEQLGPKLRLSLNVYSFNSLLTEGSIDLFDVLDFCAEYDFDAVDPTGYYFPGYPAVPTNAYVNEFKRKAFLLGLDISGTGVRTNFAHADPALRSSDLDLVEAWVATAANLGSPNLRVFAGKPNDSQHSKDKLFRTLAQELKACCRLGEERGVIIAIQNHNDLLKTAEDVNRIFEMVDSEWLGLNLDIGSYRMGDPYAEIASNIHHAITWQIKEDVWIDNKKIHTDFDKIIALVREHNYRGYLPIETLGPGDPFIKIPKLLEEVRQAMA